MLGSVQGDYTVQLSARARGRLKDMDELENCVICLEALAPSIGSNRSGEIIEVLSRD